MTCDLSCLRVLFFLSCCTGSMIGPVQDARGLSYAVMVLFMRDFNFFILE